MTDVYDLLKIGLGFVLGAFITPFVKPWTRRLERLGRKVSSESPVAVHLERNQAVIWAGSPPWVGFRCYFPNGLPDALAGAEPEPDAAVDWHEWAVRNGGIDLGLTMVKVTIQARLDVAVVVETPIVRIVDRLQAPTTGEVASRLVGGADLQPRRFVIQLGLFDPPVVDYIDGGDRENVPPPSFHLGKDEAEQFHIWAYARDNAWYDWTIDLPVIVDGVRTMVNLTDECGPLSTIGDNSDGA